MSREKVTRLAYTTGWPDPLRHPEMTVQIEHCYYCWHDPHSGRTCGLLESVNLGPVTPCNCAVAP